MPSAVQPTSRIRLIGAAVVFWLPFLLFARLADEVRERETGRVDSSFLEWLHSFATPGLDRMAVGVTTLGNAPVIIGVTLLLAALLFWKRRSWEATFVLAVIGGAAAIDTVLKLLFHRVRPALWSPVVTETDYSFPSGHAMLTSALALTLITLLWETKWRWAAVVVLGIYVLAVGLSRLYLGVHFPTDILAGWCASLVWVGLVRLVLAKRMVSGR